MGSERIKEWTQTDWTQTRSVKIKERQTPFGRSIRSGLICLPATKFYKENNSSTSLMQDP